MTRETVHTLIVSDVHLGTPLSRARNLVSFLTGTSFKRLILLGDIFDDSSFTKLTKDHWDLINHIVRLQAEEGKEIVWIRGNHDGHMSKTISELIGVTMVESFSWRFGGKKYLAIHGDQFDRFPLNISIFSKITSAAYSGIGYLKLGESPLMLLFKSFRTTWMRLSKLVSERAAGYAFKEEVDIIFCGHTHVPYKKVFERNGKYVTYYNTGCWTTSPSTYITLTGHDIKIGIYPLHFGRVGVGENHKELEQRVRRKVARMVRTH